FELLAQEAREVRCRLNSSIRIKAVLSKRFFPVDRLRRESSAPRNDLQNCDTSPRLPKGQCFGFRCGQDHLWRCPAIQHRQVARKVLLPAELSADLTACCPRNGKFVDKNDTVRRDVYVRRNSLTD